MLASRRWRDWPPREKTEEGLECALTKPPEPDSVGFVCLDLVPSVKIAGPGARPPHDPAEWREPFAQWLGSACARDPRCWGGVGCLHIAFCESAIAQDDVPCTRFTFECLLRELGFVIDEIAGVVFVCGLTFREDLESVLSR
jgi:hypothetical protein